MEQTVDGAGSPGESAPYRRLRELGIVLPRPPEPVANFVTSVREGDFLYLAGQGPLEANGVEHQRQGRRRRLHRGGLWPRPHHRHQHAGGHA